MIPPPPLDLLYKEHLKHTSNVPTYSPELAQAAQSHAEWMAQKRRLSHRGAGNSTHSQRIAEAGFESMASAENIASGFSLPEQVMEAWMKSPGHRRNIRTPYLFIGMGMKDNYWCVVFANPADPIMVTLC